VLRAWENRYRLVTPARSPGGRRLYSDADIQRLRLIREAVAGGRRVGKLAPLSVEELTAMVEEDRRESLAQSPAGIVASSSGLAQALLSETLEAVANLDPDKLNQTIHKASHLLAPTVFVDEVATRLMHKIGDLWFEGQLSPAHEHLASAVMHNILSDLTATIQPSVTAPGVVVSTPAGQRHEIGAMIVAATAEYEGWHVTYLGPDLPAEDICRAALQTNAVAVMLSVTYPLGDRLVESELLELGRMLPDEVCLLVGGQAAKSYSSVINSVGALRMNDIGHLRETLKELSEART
jgi:methanogenic corrinoid protein MtbC1